MREREGEREDWQEREREREREREEWGRRKDKNERERCALFYVLIGVCNHARQCIEIAYCCVHVLGCLCIKISVL